MLKQRLLRGAETLGRLWRSGQQCESGWAVQCSCRQKTDFCRGKELWLRLALEDGRMVDESSLLAVLEAMSVAEIKTSGVTLTVQFPSGTVDVGPASGLSWDTLVEHMGNPRSLDSVILVLSKFAGSRVASKEESHAVA